jgi:DNA-directed RNA polymerase subunit RPC12/RpoP
MPYLEFVKCEKCGRSMDIDHGATINAYHQEGRPEKDVFINPATIVWDYLIYACYTCGTQHKYTFRDIERLVREFFSSQSEKMRDIFHKLDIIDYDEMGRVIVPTKKTYREATAKRLREAYTAKE